MPEENKAVLKITAPHNCKECQLHMLTLENGKEVFSCAGHKGHGTLNPEFDFLNNYDDYSTGRAKNCLLKYDYVGIETDIKSEGEVIFIEGALKTYGSHYCNLCFYNADDKFERMRKYPKPDGMKCLNGSIGYFIYTDRVLNK